VHIYICVFVNGKGGEDIYELWEMCL
jgi:hypothetical protein